jgi:hypothetical protein
VTSSALDDGELHLETDEDGLIVASNLEPRPLGNNHMLFDRPQITGAWPGTDGRDCSKSYRILYVASFGRSIDVDVDVDGYDRYGHDQACIPIEGQVVDVEVVLNKVRVHFERLLDDR